MSPRATQPLEPSSTPPGLIRNFCIIAHIDHASRRSPTACSRSRASSPIATCARSTSTAWTSSASGASRSRAKRCGCRGERRGNLRAQHDRHPRPRRLHVRGVAFARRVRGSDPPRRRRAGHRGADAREPLPRARERPSDHPGPQQDRPARRRPREVRAELANLIGGDPDDVLRVSGKTGQGVEELLDRIVERIPAPTVVRMPPRAP